jgi:lipoteichoic acid synthase
MRLPRGAPYRVGILLWAPASVLALATKLDKARLLEPDAGVASLFLVCADELLLGLLGYVATVWALARLRARLRAAAEIVLFAGASALSSAYLIEHLYFRATRLVPDWYVLKEAVRELPHLQGLFRAQLGAAHVATLVAPWLVYLVALVWSRRGGQQRQGEAIPIGARQFFWAAVAALAAAGSLVAEAPGRLAGIRRAVVTTLISDVGADLLRGASREAQRARGDAAAAATGPQRLLRREAPRAQNVVIVVLESVGALYTSPYGRHATTPFLKQLASEGALVERAYTVVPHTSKALV